MQLKIGASFRIQMCSMATLTPVIYESPTDTVKAMRAEFSPANIHYFWRDKKGRYWHLQQHGSYTGLINTDKPSYQLLADLASRAQP